MKKMVLTLFALFSLFLREAAADDYSCCCERPFNGFYVGGNAAVLSHIAYRNDYSSFLSSSGGWSLITTNIAGGVQAGYDWQCGDRLIGIVGDWNAAANHNKLTTIDPENSFGGDATTRLNWFSTIRARAGVVSCSTLFYLTGGAAVVNFKTKWNDGTSFFHQSRARWGWTGGVGAEFLAYCNFTVGADILFMIFDEDNRVFSDTLNYTFGHADTCWTGRLSINYRL